MSTENEAKRSVTIKVRDQALPTPRLAFYTQSGCIPYINYNFIRKNDGIFYRTIDDDSGTDLESSSSRGLELLKLNIGDLLDLHSNNVLQHYFGQSYFDQFTFMLTQYDSLIPAYQDLKSTPDSIPVMTMHGKKMVTLEQMRSIASQTGAQYAQSLADINTPPFAKKKWTAKAVIRSSKFLEETFAKKSKTNATTLSKDDHQIDGDEHKRIKLNGNGGDENDDDRNERPSYGIWATITGGFSPKDRADCCRDITTKYSGKLSGIIIDAFFGYHEKRNDDIATIAAAAETDCDDFRRSIDSFGDCADILRRHVIPNLPAELPRALWGVFLPDDMLRAIDCGIDLLDSSICTRLTKRALALPCPLIDLRAAKLRFTRDRSISADQKNSNDQDDVDDQDESPDRLIDLTRKAYARSNIPLCVECRCHTCVRKFSRAYIHHLTRRNELNGSMLLQIHNHFALSQFFAHIRRLRAEHRFETLLINSQLGVADDNQQLSI